MERIPGATNINDLHPQTPGAFALAVYTKDKQWVVVAHIDGEITAICKEQANGEEIPREITGPLSFPLRAAARLQCKAIIDALHTIDKEHNNMRRSN